MDNTRFKNQFHGGKIKLLHFSTIFVGLNDILQDKDVIQTKSNLKGIVRALKDLGKHIIIITLPRTLHKDQRYYQTIFTFIGVLKGFNQDKRIDVLPFQLLFWGTMVPSHRIDFELFYWNGKPDRIHCSGEAHRHRQIHTQIKEIIDREEIS